MGNVILTDWIKAFHKLLKFKNIPYLRGFILSLKFDKKALVKQKGKVIVIKDNAIIEVGDRTVFYPNVKLSCVGDREKTAKLKIGKKCTIGDRTEIHCGDSITIGDEVLISWDCNILDRDYHSVDGETEKTNPVIVGDCVWIGCRSIILKGVTIGEGAVVAAGSIVTENVPEFTLVAGNPAKIKKKIKSWKNVDN